MRTGEQYLASLRDGRRVFLEGEAVGDVTTHRGLAEPAHWVAAGYDRFYSPDPHAYHPMYDLPGSTDDLRARINLLNESDYTASTSAAVLALLTAAPALATADPVYKRRIEDFFEMCRRDDVRMVEVITDAKGNRTLPPSKQDDPDLYVRVVERRSDGVVVNGAKFHISGAPVAHELVTMPTKRMRLGEEEYAIAFSVPANAPGVSLVTTSYAPKGDDVRHYPVSGEWSLPESMVVFDHVFVPYERVFLNGETEHSALIAHSLGLWERLSGLADMAHLADVFVGAAQLISEANGLDRVPHIKDKIAEMAIYATVTRGTLEAALVHTEQTPDGLVYPSELYTNAGKYYAATEYHLMVRHLHDIAGGSVITAPTLADLEHPEIGQYVEKYLRTMDGVDARTRMALFHLIRDLTADALGGWFLVANLLSGGGLLAQRTVTRKHYDMEHAKSLARRKAGLVTAGER